MLHICFATDKRWLPFVQTAIYEIIIKKNKDTKITFYVLIDKVKNCTMFEAFNTIDNIKVITQELDSDDSFKDSLSYHYTWHNKFGYLRLLIPELPIFKDIDRVLYIDVDMFAQRDVTDLYHLDLNNKPLGCVRNWWFVRFDNWDGFAEAKGIDNGLILMDLPKLREIKFTERCIEASKFIPTDQYVLNRNMLEYVNFIEPKYMLPYQLIKCDDLSYRNIEHWNRFYNINYKSIDELLVESYFWHIPGDKDKYYKEYEPIKDLFDTTRKRVDQFFETGKVMIWKKEDDLRFYNY